MADNGYIQYGAGVSMVALNDMLSLNNNLLSELKLTVTSMWLSVVRSDINLTIVPKAETR